MGIVIDESEGAVATVRWKGDQTDAELRSVLELVERRLARGAPFGLLVDARDAAPLTPTQLALVVSHMRTTGAAATRFLVQAMVIDSAVMRGVFYAILWAVPLGFPVRVFAEVGEAARWIDAQLRARAGGAETRVRDASPGPTTRP